MKNLGISYMATVSIALVALGPILELIASTIPSVGVKNLTTLTGLKHV